MRLILDGTVIKVRLDRKATAVSLLIVLGIRRDGQKVVLAIKTMGGESEAGAVHALLCRGYTDVVDADLSRYFDTPGGPCSTICWPVAWRRPAHGRRPLVRHSAQPAF